MTLLNEIAMNMSTYSKIEKQFSSSAHIGFEFEMIYDVKTNIPIDHKDETIDINKLTTLTDISEYFYITNATERSINRDYLKWKEAMIENDVFNYSVDNREELKDLSPREKDRRLDEYRSELEDKTNLKDWIREEYSYTLAFVEMWNLEIKYDDYEIDGHYLVKHQDLFSKRVIYPAIEKSLYRHTKILATPQYSYHSVKKDSREWYIEPDGSIDGSADGEDWQDHTDVELVSAAMPLTTAMSKLGDVFNWMQKVKLRTNSSTGLHINISIPEIKNIDTFKLVLFLGEEYNLEKFNRTDNEYAKMHKDDIIRGIINGVINDGRIPKEFDDLQVLGADLIKTNEKYRTVNFRNLKDGYFEFRVAGGQGYEKDYDKIKRTVLSFVTVLEIACNPDLEKQEYAKKTQAFFDKVRQHITEPKETAKFYINKSLPPELSRFKTETTSYAEEYTRMYSYYIYNGKSPTYFVKFVAALLIYIDRFNLGLSLKEKVYIKFMFKRLNITPQFMERMQLISTHEQDLIKKYLFKETE